jgi:hypothetical protein
MGIRIKGQYKPVGMIKFRRSLIAPVFAVLPSITYNTLLVGDTFTANDGTASPANAVVSRRWLLDGEQIGTGSFVVVEVPGSLVLEVTYTNGAGSVTETTSAIDIDYAELVFSTLPSISYPDLFVGSTFTAVDGEWTPLNADMERRWLLGGVEIGTDETVTPEAGGILTLEVTISNPGGSLTKTASITIAAHQPAFTVDPSISPNGGPMGTTFTGNDGTYQYGTVTSRSWLFDGQVINGATTDTYISDGIGQVSYRVTITGAGGTLTKTSTAVSSTSVPEKLNPPVWATQTGNLGTYAEGTAISIPLLVTDPENNVQKYEITSGALPNGTTINLTTGLISGTLAEVVTDTVYTFTVKVTDRTNLTLTGTFSINVANVKTTVVWETDNSSDLAQPAPGETITVALGATSS